jgi:hypothetical protein
MRAAVSSGQLQHCNKTGKKTYGLLDDDSSLSDPDVDGRMILRWMFRKLEGVGD